jgi:hypothetical protein
MSFSHRLAIGLFEALRIFPAIEIIFLKHIYLMLMQIPCSLHALSLNLRHYIWCLAAAATPAQMFER